MVPRGDRLAFRRAALVTVVVGLVASGYTWPFTAVRMKRLGARWKHTTGEEVLQLHVLQLSDQWAPAVQRATRPLTKPVQIAPGLAPVARAALIASSQGARTAA